jgi:NAD(P)-dependent dehydrogenase (short-subunit alcohol dehydrogenase family)
MRPLSALLDLSGRAALVVGGAGHVGLAASEALAELGCAVAISDVDDLQCQARAEDIAERFGVQTVALAADLADEAGTRALPHAAADALGSLDVLVHCAAYVGTTQTPGWSVPFAEQTADAWDSALRVNLTSAFVLAHEAAGLLGAGPAGSIVLVASIYGLVGPQPDLYEGTTMANPLAYGASKAGLIQLSRSLATTLAPDIRVNALVPGGIERGQPEVFRGRYEERTPLGRMATEEDLKGAIAYLASDASAYVTGHALIVDGGWTAW